MIRVALGAKKAHHGAHRRKPAAAVPPAFGTEPRLVELETIGQQFGNRLMHTGGEQATGASLCHDEWRMQRDETAAAIVAGGRARRFGGRDKSRLVVDGRTIIARQIDVLQLVASEIFIVSNDAGRFADLDLPVFPDHIAGAGAIGGIYTALEVARAEFVVTVACDLPFLDAGLLARLVDLSRPCDGAWVHGAHGVEPLIACYRRRARAAIEQAILAGRLRASDLGAEIRLAEMTVDEVRAFGAPERLLANINSPEDFALLQ